MLNLISLSGPVGSGKTVQVNALHYILRERGYKVTVTYLKVMNIFSYFILVLLYKIVQKEGNNTSIWRFLFKKKKDIIEKLFNLLAILDCISISIKFLFRIYIPLLLGNTVLVEEYIPAIISDYLSFKARGLWGLGGNLIISLAQRYHLMVHERTCFVYLYAPISILRKRWLIRGTTPEKDEYIKIQQLMLRKIIHQLKGNCIFEISTAHRPISLTAQEILNYLGKL